MFSFYGGSGCSLSVPAKSRGSARKSLGCVSGGSVARCLIEQTKSKDSPPPGAASSSIKEGEEAIGGLEAGPPFDEEVIHVSCKRKRTWPAWRQVCGLCQSERTTTAATKR